MKENTDLVLCDCGSTDHQIIIHHDLEDKMVYLHIHLNKRPFWRRVVNGTKYIFGYSCRYGHFDEIILNKESAAQFQKVVDTLSGL